MRTLIGEGEPAPAFNLVLSCPRCSGPLVPVTEGVGRVQLNAIARCPQCEAEWIVSVELVAKHLPSLTRAEKAAALVKARECQPVNPNPRVRAAAGVAS